VVARLLIAQGFLVTRLVLFTKRSVVQSFAHYIQKQMIIGKILHDMKIEHDKYFTPIHIAKRLIKKTYEVIGEENITDIIEPSAGQGAFSLLMDCQAYDLYPEHSSIKKADFLTLDIKHKKGRLFIGNPPFGERNSLSRKFYDKSAMCGDYIAYILPISQLDNPMSLYKFDLIYSEDLDHVIYSGVNLHCCFNIYKRPDDGMENSGPPNFEMNDITVKEYRRNGSYEKPSEYDFGMGAWGNGVIGKEVEYVGQYASELYITVNNKKYKNDVVGLLRDTDWLAELPTVSMKRMQKWRMCRFLRRNFPNLN
jgi:hypothetical protein